MNIVDRVIYEKAHKEWGAGAQITMVQEECMELALAVSRFLQDRASKRAVMEEMADVSIMIDQLIVTLDISEGDFEEIRKAKLTRLANILAGHNE